MTDGLLSSMPSMASVATAAGVSTQPGVEDKANDGPRIEQ